MKFGNLLILVEEESDLIPDSKTLSADSKLFVSSLLAGSKSSNFLSYSDRRESTVCTSDFAGPKLCSIFSLSPGLFSNEFLISRF